MRLDLVSLWSRKYDPAIAFFTGRWGSSWWRQPSVSSRDPQVKKRWAVVRPPGGGPGLVLARAASTAERARIGDQTGGRVALISGDRGFRNSDHAAFRQRGVVFLEAPRENQLRGGVAVFQDCEGQSLDLIERR